VFSAENKGPKMYDTSFALELCTAAQNVPWCSTLHLFQPLEFTLHTHDIVKFRT
jgi:hypothetical protein